jgi:hypothetical protein
MRAVFFSWLNTCPAHSPLPTEQTRSGSLAVAILLSVGVSVGILAANAPRLYACRDVPWKPDRSVLVSRELGYDNYSKNAKPLDEF